MQWLKNALKKFRTPAQDGTQLDAPEPMEDVPAVEIDSMDSDDETTIEPTRWELFKDYVKSKLPAYKPPDPDNPPTSGGRFKKFISYANRVLLDATANILSKAAVVGEAWALTPTPQAFVMVAPVMMAAFFSKLWHRSKNTALNLTSVLLGELNKIGPNIPTFYSLGKLALPLMGIAAAPGSTPLITVAVVSLTLGVLQYALSVYLRNREAKQTEPTNLSQILGVVQKYGFSFLTSVGIGALLRETLIILGPALNRLNIISAGTLGVLNGPASYLLVAIPAAIKLSSIISSIIADKYARSPLTKRKIENYSIAVDASLSYLQSTIYQSTMYRVITAAYLPGDNLPDLPNVLLTIPAVILGAIKPVYEVLKATRIRRKEEARRAEIIRVGGEENLGATELRSPLDFDNDSDAVIEALAERLNSPSSMDSYARMMDRGLMPASTADGQDRSFHPLWSSDDEGEDAVLIFGEDLRGLVEQQGSVVDTHDSGAGVAYSPV